MNTNLIRTTVAATLLAVATSIAAQEAERPVAVNTDGMPDHLKVRVEEAAKQGTTALRRYLDSTRHIYNIRMIAIVKPEPQGTPMVMQEEPAKVADLSEGKK